MSEKQESEMPPNPFGQLMEFGTLLHEAFVSYQAVGFTREEAFELVKAMMLQAIRNPKGEGESE